MVRFYVLQVKMGKISIDDVPAKWRKAVRNAIAEESTK